MSIRCPSCDSKKVVESPDGFPYYDCWNCNITFELAKEEEEVEQ